MIRLSGMGFILDVNIQNLKHNQILSTYTISKLSQCQLLTRFILET